MSLSNQLFNVYKLRGMTWVTCFTCFTCQPCLMFCMFLRNQLFLEARSNFVNISATAWAFYERIAPKCSGNSTLQSETVNLDQRSLESLQNGKNVVTAARSTGSRRLGQFTKNQSNVSKENVMLYGLYTHAGIWTSDLRQWQCVFPMDQNSLTPRWASVKQNGGILSCGLKTEPSVGNRTQISIAWTMAQ